MLSQDSVWINSSWQKKCRLTKEKTERPSPKRAEQAWMAYTISVDAAATNDDDDSSIKS